MTFFAMLPDSTKTKAAINEDPEYARARLSEISSEDIDKILEQRAEKSDDRHLTTEGHTLEIEKLNQIIDTINELIIVVSSMAGAKGEALKWKPTKRPETEFSRMLKDLIYKREQEDKNELLAELGF